MATLAGTLAAVHGLLLPLVASGDLGAAIDGETDGPHAFPAAWVFFGPAADAFDPAGRTLEMMTTCTGGVRIYVERKGLWLSDRARLVAPIDAVRTVLQAAPTLGGLVDRFVVTGHTQADQDEQIGALFVDLGWSAQWIKPDTYAQDW